MKSPRINFRLTNRDTIDALEKLRTQNPGKTDSEIMRDLLYESLDSEESKRVMDLLEEILKEVKK